MKLPHYKVQVMNLRKVVDLPSDEITMLFRMGLGELVQQVGVKQATIVRDKLIMNKEYEDVLKASTITFKLISFKAYNEK